MMRRDSKFNIVFTDFDGVLTSQLETPGSYINHSPDEYGVSPMCFERLVYLCKRTNSKVIVTSNWRRFDDDGMWSYCTFGTKHTFKNHLPELKKMLGSLYAGDLPKNRGMNKSQALVMWFDQHPEFKGQFVVFDDDTREMLQSTSSYDINRHFILTDFMTGLTDNDVEDACSIMEM